MDQEDRIGLRVADDEPLLLDGREYHSRLLVGTGRYQSLEICADCLAASGCEIVFVALRRVRIDVNISQPFLPPELLRKYTVVPNTSGCKTADHAVRVATYWRELSAGAKLIRLDIISDEQTMKPDPKVTLHAARLLVAEGFSVLAYTDCEMRHAQKLRDIGVKAVLCRGAPIGSGKGILRPDAIRRIAERIDIPVFVMGGIGQASDVALAMELGADGVVVNSAIARAGDPRRMAVAMRHACEAGRNSYLAHRIPQVDFADPASPRGDF